MKPSINIIISVLIVFFLFFYTSTFTVNEGEQALILNLGNIETDASGKPHVEGPGLHFKIPLIDQARIFDTRLQTLDIKSSPIVTAEQKDVIVDYYVKWRINNLALYYTRTGGDLQLINKLLAQQLNDSLRAQFGKRTISEVVSNDRASIMDIVSQQASAKAQDLGITVVDVRIKRIDLPSEVSQAVFERMRAKRESVAAQLRSTGKANADAARAQADAQVTVIIATATNQAATIRSQGDAQAAKIYADAYSKDADFFAFLRSMQAYKTVFSNTQNNMLVLRPDSQFFKYFNSGIGSNAPATSVKK